MLSALRAERGALAPLARGDGGRGTEACLDEGAAGSRVDLLASASLRSPAAVRCPPSVLALAIAVHAQFVISNNNPML